jgi:hypothetical protein
MDSDGGLDSTSEHHPCTDNKSSNIEKKNSNCEASSSKGVVKIVGGYPVRKNPLDEDLKDPLPGPSNSASDFDLEVFDSGSSCSNEECWTVIPDKIISTEFEELDKEVESLNTNTMDECPSESETELAGNIRRNLASSLQDEDSTLELENEPGSTKSGASHQPSSSSGQQPLAGGSNQQSKRNRETQTNSDLLIEEGVPSTSKVRLFLELFVYLCSL